MQSIRLLIQADFPVTIYKLSKHKQNPYLKAKCKKLAKFTKLSFCQKLIFWHQTSSCKCSMCLYCAGKESRLFQQKLWYKLISSYMHYLCTNKIDLIRITKGNNSNRIGLQPLFFLFIMSISMCLQCLMKFHHCLFNLLRKTIKTPI